MSCSFGSKFKITVFGQSHSEAIGVVVEGVPAGLRLDINAIEAFLRRRAPGQGTHTTARKEPDIPQILSGVVNGVTCGTPLCAVIENTNVRSGDYDALKDLPRPGHADFSAHVKFGNAADLRGGGNFSGRMTAPLCFAGAVAKQILAQDGITVGAHIARLAKISDDPFDPVNIDAATLNAISEKSFPIWNDKAGEAMLAAIAEAKAAGDSVGGVIECAAVGVPAGIGEPIFDGVENVISHIVFGIPAVKGIEFGSGFAGADLFGSENNDAFRVKDGKIVTETNHHGGALGGITSGMPLLFRAAIKPTPSIAKPQTTVNLQTLQEETVTVGGRHDPCIVPRAVPCMEAAMAVALMNLR